MSIRNMIALHPDVGGDANEPLSIAARHAMLCAALCTSCADACSAERMDMRQCIRVCLDCADICQATGQMLSRRTEAEWGLLQKQLEVCLLACRVCGAECEKHAPHHEHCQVCAQACHRCEATCHELLGEPVL